MTKKSHELTYLEQKVTNDLRIMKNLIDDTNYMKEIELKKDHYIIEY